jgi:hypothetical protein
MVEGQKHLLDELSGGGPSFRALLPPVPRQKIAEPFGRHHFEAGDGAASGRAGRANAGRPGYLDPNPVAGLPEQTGHA